MEKAYLLQKQAQKETWREAIYGLMVQRDSMKASHLRFFRKLKVAKLH